MTLSMPILPTVNEALDLFVKFSNHVIERLDRLVDALERIAANLEGR